MVPKDLDEYVGWVLSQKPGLKDVEPDVLDQLKNNFISSLEDQINAAVLASMNEQQVDELEKLLDTSDPAAVKNFTQTAVPQTSEIVAEILLKFKTDYVGA